MSAREDYDAKVEDEALFARIGLADHTRTFVLNDPFGKELLRRIKEDWLAAQEEFASASASALDNREWLLDIHERLRAPETILKYLEGIEMDRVNAIEQIKHRDDQDAGATDF